MYTLVFSAKPAQSERCKRHYKKSTPDIPGPVDVRHDLGDDVPDRSVAHSDGTVHGVQPP